MKASTAIKIAALAALALLAGCSDEFTADRIRAHLAEQRWLVAEGITPGRVVIHDDRSATAQLIFPTGWNANPAAAREMLKLACPVGEHLPVLGDFWREESNIDAFELVALTDRKIAAFTCTRSHSHVGGADLD